MWAQRFWSGSFWAPVFWSKIGVTVPLFSADICNPTIREISPIDTRTLGEFNSKTIGEC